MTQLNSFGHVLKRTTLFIKDIDEGLSKEQVKNELLSLCPKELGKICVPVDHLTAASLGCAYCNYDMQEYAEAAYKKYRYRFRINGKPVRMFIAVNTKEHRDLVFGPHGLRFFIVIKNLSPSVDVATLCRRFEEYGEVFQAKTDEDPYGQCYGMVQYVNLESVMLACQRANKTTFEHTVIIVEPHKNGYSTLPSPSSVVYPSIHSREEFPALRGASSGHHTNGHGSAYIAAADTPTSTTSSNCNYSAASSVSEHSRRAVYLEESMLDYAGGVDGHTVYYQQGSSSQPNGYYTRQHSAVPGVTVSANGNGARTPEAYHPLVSLHAQRTRAHQANHLQTHHSMQAQRAPPMPIPVPVAPQPQPAVEMAAEPDTAVVTENGRPQTSLKGCITGIMKQLERLEELLNCPMTLEMFKDPVIAADGYTYEREAIEDWLRGHDTSPMTNEPLLNKLLIPNKVILQVIMEYGR